MEGFRLEMILIDVRLPAEYEQSHIDGARNVPLDRVVYFLKSDVIPHDKARSLYARPEGDRTWHPWQHSLMVTAMFTISNTAWGLAGSKKVCLLSLGKRDLCYTDAGASFKV